MCDLLSLRDSEESQKPKFLKNLNLTTKIEIPEWCWARNKKDTPNCVRGDIIWNKIKPNISSCYNIATISQLNTGVSRGGEGGSMEVGDRSVRKKHVQSFL